MPGLVHALVALTLCANPYLEEGRALYQSVRYAQAEPVLKLALDVASSTPEERREAFDLYARCLAARGSTDEAIEAYARLLAAQPHAPAPEASPKIVDLFQRAKQRVYPPEFASLRQTPAAPGRLALEVVDPWGQVRQIAVALGCSEQAPAVAKTPRDRRVVVELPPQAPGAAPLCWAAQAIASGDRPLATLSGTVAAPAAPPPTKPMLDAAPRQPPPAPASQVSASGTRWVPWALTAAAVVAAGAGAGFGFSAAAESRAADQAKFASETRDHDATARERAIAANWLAGGALALGVGATVAWVW